MIFYTNKKLTKGFTIAELIITIFIVSVVGILVSRFELNTFSLNNIISNGLSAQNEARSAVKNILAEVKSVSQSSLGAYPVAEANSTTFSFYSDTDNDLLKERIRYFLDGTTLKKGIIIPTGNPLVYNSNNEKITEIVHNVSNGAVPIFDFYDSSYDGTTQPLSEPVNVSSVRLVKVTFLIDKDPTHLPGPISITTQVSMRNLKDNL